MNGYIQNSVALSMPVLSVPQPTQFSYWHKDWVPFGDGTNLYPQYTASLLTVSPTHAAIVDSKTAFINTDFIIDIIGGSGSYIDEENIDGDGGSLEELIADIAVNLAVYESFYMEVIYNKPRTRVVALKCIPYENVRVGKYNEEGKIDTFYISPDWANNFVKKHKPTPIAAFDPNNIDTNSQIIYMRMKRPNQPYYTVPSYMSAVQWILLEDDIAEFNRNNVTSGFFPSMIMNFFNGEPTEDEKGELESYIGSKFSGKGASKLMMFFGNDPDKKVDLQAFQPPDLPDYFQAIIPEIKLKIFAGHKASPALLGVFTATGLNNNSDELATQYQLYLKSTINPLQKLVINAFKKAYLVNGHKIEARFENELILQGRDIDITTSDKDGVNKSATTKEDTDEK